MALDSVWRTFKGCAQLWEPWDTHLGVQIDPFGPLFGPFLGSLFGVPGPQMYSIRKGNLEGTPKRGSQKGVPKVSQKGHLGSCREFVVFPRTPMVNSRKLLNPLQDYQCIWSKKGFWDPPTVVYIMFYWYRSGLH